MKAFLSPSIPDKSGRLRALATRLLSAGRRAGQVRRPRRDFLAERNLRFVVPCEPLMDVVAVAVLSSKLLHLEFSTGEGRVLSLARFLEEVQGEGPEAVCFPNARVSQGSLVWPGGIDLAPETLYELSVPSR